MKEKSRKIILICEKCASRNYNFLKSTISVKERLVLKKFCSKCNERTLHKETR
ncbi:50S ribosomal protein L33 [Spiroplasma endosymbiont of Crioceris asparagi]|uniref:50S ribosomal protein L33 n=1 Tax=Spiroplasma endosymbiont of Crioceris asparagi TaxID=3066286 RepID=UPI0030D08BD9